MLNSSRLKNTFKKYIILDDARFFEVTYSIVLSFALLLRLRFGKKAEHFFQNILFIRSAL